MPETHVTLVERLLRLAARLIPLLPARLQLWLSGGPAITIDGQTLDPHVQLLLAINRRRSPFGLCEPNPAEARARFRHEMLVYAGPKTRVGAARDISITREDEDGSLLVRHYAPDAPSQDILVFLHGGGFVIGDLDTHDEACRLLCLRARVHVLSVDYRLAPEHPFPAGLDDALASLRWAQGNAASLGADPARVSIGGDSAGGNLSAVAARLAARGGAPPAAQLLIYPTTDAASEYPSRQLFGEDFFLSRADSDEFFRHYLTGTGVGRDDPRVSPLRATDLGALPPTLLVTAGFDILRDQGRAYAAALRAAGGTVCLRHFPSLGHGFINTVGVSPAARRATANIARDWRALLDALGSDAHLKALCGEEESAP